MPSPQIHPLRLDKTINTALDLLDAIAGSFTRVLAADKIRMSRGASG